MHVCRDLASTQKLVEMFVGPAQAHAVYHNYMQTHVKPTLNLHFGPRR